MHGHTKIKFVQQFRLTVKRSVYDSNIVRL